MKTEDLLNELNLIFKKVLKKDKLELTCETTAKDVEGWDSLTNMLLITEIEKHFNIHFNYREIVKFKNIGDLCSTILNKTK